MDLWFKEIHNGSFGLLIKVRRSLYHGESQYQKLDIVETEDMGRMMLLDGLVMFTERDEFVYHEMIAHVPLTVHPNPGNVLVIGGGDGGTVREIARHPQVTRIDLVEIDELVVDKAKEFFPTVSCELDNPKVTVHYKDGIEFVKKSKDKYDVIIVDSTDPIGPAVGLFSHEFYQDCFNALQKDGILTAQTESPFFDVELIKKIYANLQQAFPLFRMYLAPVPTYPGGYWSFAFASKKYRPILDLNKERAETISRSTKFYNPQIHVSGFSLPNFVKKIFS